MPSNSPNVSLEFEFELRPAQIDAYLALLSATGGPGAVAVGTAILDKIRTEHVVVVSLPATVSTGRLDPPIGVPAVALVTPRQFGETLLNSAAKFSHLISSDVASQHQFAALTLAHAVGIIHVSDNNNLAVSSSVPRGGPDSLSLITTLAIGGFFVVATGILANYSGPLMFAKSLRHIQELFKTQFEWNSPRGGGDGPPPPGNLQEFLGDVKKCLDQKGRQSTIDSDRGELTVRYTSPGTASEGFVRRCDITVIYYESDASTRTIRGQPFGVYGVYKDGRYLRPDDPGVFSDCESLLKEIGECSQSS